MKLNAFPYSTRKFLFRQFTVYVRNLFDVILSHAGVDSHSQKRFQFFQLSN